MKIGIMQPYFFPYLGYWQLIHAVDKFVIYDDVNYIKGGWINRNYILMNGEKQRITVPLEGASSFLKINQIKLLQKDKILEKILKTIVQGYRKAPYFSVFFPIIEDVFSYPCEYISQLSEYSIRRIAEYAGIQTEIILSSSLAHQNALKGQDRVISLVKYLGGTEYYNAIGGTELYSFQDFKNKGIVLYFLEMKKIVYPQFRLPFVPDLSILDVLMFNSKVSIASMLDQYNLIESER